jgi:AraC-like DNA-binding protein
VAGSCPDSAIPKNGERVLRHRIAERQGIGSTGYITQASRLNFVSITTDAPLLILVIHGRKVIRSGGREFRAGAGEAIAVAEGEALSFENIPSPDGSYEARWIAFDPGLVAGFSGFGEAEPVRPVAVLGAMPERLAEAHAQAVEALVDAEGTLPDAVARHRVEELLVWLGMSGFRFPQQTSGSLAIRLRKLILPDPARAWASAELAAALGVSEATLRRRLQQEGTSLRAVLTDVRMTHAMQLLQCSKLPVSEIAASTGFESQSRFAIRFRHRFGFPPTAVRGRVVA